MNFHNGVGLRDGQHNGSVVLRHLPTKCHVETSVRVVHVILTATRNLLHVECFDWNAKPLRGGGAFRKQRNMQWRMVSQHGVQFCVVGCGGTRHVERRLDRRMRRKGEAPVQRDVKDEPEIEINRVERR
jgi:hypothetical protein